MITIANSKFSIASFDFIGRRKHNSMTTKNFVTLKAEDSAMVAFDLKLWLFNFLVAIKILKKLVAIKIFLTVLSIPFATFFSYSIKLFRKNNSFFEKKLVQPKFARAPSLNLSIICLQRRLRVGKQEMNVLQKLKATTLPKIDTALQTFGFS